MILPRYGTQGPHYEQYKEDYRNLYIETIMTAVTAEDRTRPFLSSSPFNGKLSREQNWISENPRPSDPRYGNSRFDGLYKKVSHYQSVNPLITKAVVHFLGSFQSNSR